MTPEIFVIGDVHGHLDRLEALLKQEGLLDRCENCDGAGLIWTDPDHSLDESDCPSCDGDGWQRKRRDVIVVQLGDLGHFGTKQSPTGDMLCYKYVTVNRWADVVLWGNHDRAAIDGSHHATDFFQVPEAMHYIRRLWAEGRMQVAFAAHGFLITHAGLANAFRGQRLPDENLRTDPQALADWLNDEDEKYLLGVLGTEHDGSVETGPINKSALAIINAIGARRGGRVPTGGILWRDINENLYDAMRQIFGHSADEKHQVRYCWKGVHTRKPAEYDETWMARASYCIDVGGKGEKPGDACLAGIWLPSEKVVRVDL